MELNYLYMYHPKKHETDPSPLNAWGGLNADIHYRFGDHYALSVSPGVKMGLNKMDNRHNDIQAISELSFNFRYIFDK